MGWGEGCASHSSAGPPSSTRPPARPPTSACLPASRPPARPPARLPARRRVSACLPACRPCCLSSYQSICPLISINLSVDISATHHSSRPLPAAHSTGPYPDGPAQAARPRGELMRARRPALAPPIRAGAAAAGAGRAGTVPARWGAVTTDHAAGTRPYAGAQQAAYRIPGLRYAREKGSLNTSRVRRRAASGLPYPASRDTRGSGRTGPAPPAQALSRAHRAPARASARWGAVTASRVRRHAARTRGPPHSVRAPGRAGAAGERSRGGRCRRLDAPLARQSLDS